MKLSFAFLQDYFSARGLTLTRQRTGRKFVYMLTNGLRVHTFVGIPAIIAFEYGGTVQPFTEV